MLLSAVAFCIFYPQDFLPALLDGAQEGAKCALTLFCIYSIWMGLSAVAEESGLTRRVAAMLSPACTRFFRTDDKEAIEDISMNISCNLIGIGGAATPYAVKAINKLEESGNERAQNLLFILNATSVQLIPTTVIALRAAGGSASAYDIVLPSLIATVVSTGCAVALYLLSQSSRRKNKSEKDKKGKAGKGKDRCAT